MKQYKILISTPTSNHKNYCVNEWLLNTEAIMKHSNAHLHIVDNSQNTDNYIFLKMLAQMYEVENAKISYLGGDKPLKEVMTDCNNHLRDIVLNEGYDFMLSLESDILPPHDIIEQLLKARKPIVSAGYFIGNLTNSVYIQADVEPIGIIRNTTINEYNNFKFVDGKVKEGFQNGLGCTLIHRSVLEKVKFRVEPDGAGHADTYFHADCLALGLTPYIDTSVICRHENQTWNNLI